MWSPHCGPINTLKFPDRLMSVSPPMRWPDDEKVTTASPEAGDGEKD